MNNVIYVQTIHAPEISDIIDDAMLPVSEGIYFHHRLQLLIVVRDQLPPAIAAHLPHN